MILWDIIFPSLLKQKEQKEKGTSGLIYEFKAVATFRPDTSKYIIENMTKIWNLKD